MNQYGAWDRGWSMGWLGRSVAARFHHALTARGRHSVPACPNSPGMEVGEGVRPATGPWARDDLLGRVEAVLFLAREPLSSRKLARLAGLADGTQARTFVRRLNRLYDAGGWAFRVEEVAGGYQLMSRPKFAPWLRRLQPPQVEVRLSPPALETLAVVAYRQPVLRAEIESVRGVQCDEVLRQLIERDLVRVVGRSEQLGRPFLYGTSKRFLQVFGLRHLDELPRPDSWPAAGQEAAAARTIQTAQVDATNQLFNQEEYPVSTSLKPYVGELSRAARSPGLPSGSPTVARSSSKQRADLVFAQDEEEAHLDDAGPEEDEDEEEYDDDFGEEEEDEEEQDEEEDEDWDEEWEEVEDEDWDEVDDEDWDEEEEEEEEDEEDFEEEELDEEDFDEDEEEDEEDEEDYEEFDDEED